ncbi:MAG TPA: DUF4249 domain-containing protein [Mucilaginibacter sp.]|jgi:hypothetical protein|nr:DUF4249 domain-containing protein [Mucilaginibacter sp.]
MKTSALLVLFPFFLLLCTSCQKPYQPKIISVNPNYLVVEGVINSGSDSTFITLSRTALLNSKTIKPETGAIVTVESDQNDRYNLAEVKPGIYGTANLNLPTDRHYRLHIFTANNKEYASDFVESKISPPIDSVFYEPRTAGVQFFVSTHDPANKTRYYKWDYDETWTYFSTFDSQLIYQNHQLNFRDPDSLVSTCYRHATPSNSFYVSNSTGLSQDVIAHFPVGYVPASSGKITHVYCLNVKQTAITADAFKYWQNLKKNTEQLGSIFDPYPSTTLGNIHCLSDAKDAVLGFISVSTVTTKRIFLAGRSLPYHYPKHVPPPDSDECVAGFLPLEPQATLAAREEQTFFSGDTIPIKVVESLLTFKVTGYTYAPKICVDCRVVGGTNIRPSYWPVGL